jgi:hypothetical protein
VADLASRARWTINSLLAQNKKLSKLKTAKETDDADLEHAFNTASEVAGEIEKPGAGSLDIEYYEENGTPEVNWQKLKDSREYFTLTRQVIGGRRVQYGNCRVANITAEDDDEGGHMLSIKVTWRTRKEL